MTAGVRDGKAMELRRRFRKLEVELNEVQNQIASLGPGESIPGVFLIIETAGKGAVIPATLAIEIVRLVEYVPLPLAPPHVLGTFLFRGQSVVAIDLARYLGCSQEPRLDSHMIIMQSVRPVALVVDRVNAVVEAPVLSESTQNPSGISSSLVMGICKYADRLLPILRIYTILEGFRR